MSYRTCGLGGCGGRLLVAGIAAGTLAAIPATALGKCKAGVHKYGSGQARTFCGPAHATITIGKQKTNLKGGDCEVTKQGFTINIGTVLLGVSSSTPPDYFGVTVGRPGFSSPASKDGTYRGNDVVALVLHHKRYVLEQPAVTLTGKRSKGSFSAMEYGGGPVTGTFSCG